jgi:4-amino-4-deoxy-L-arabinose transferase-like glycosyltransferase
VLSRALGEPDPCATKDFFTDKITIGLIVSSLVVQLIYVFAANAPTNIGDQLVYKEIGDHFKSYLNDGYFGPNLRTPGYGAFLALHYELGLGEWAIKVSQALILSATCGVVAYLAARKKGIVAGRIAALLFCCYLPLISFSSMILEEALSIGLATAGVTACLLADKRRPELRVTYVAASLLLLAVIVRPNLGAVAAPALLFLILSSSSRREAMTRLAAIVVVFAVIFGPWIGRNLALFSKPLVLGDADAASLAQGLHLPIDKEVGQFGAYRRAQRFFADQRSDGFGARDLAGFEAGRELRRDLSDKTGEFLTSRIYLQYQMWFWPTTARIQYGESEKVPYAAIQLLHLILLFSGIIGLVLTRHQTSSRVFGAIAVCIALPYLLYYPGPRYALPTMPFLIVGAAISFQALTESLRSHSRGYAWAPTAHPERVRENTADRV